MADNKIQTVIPSPIIRGLMQAEDMVFTKKYKEIAGPRIITDLAVEFTPFIAGKSKSKIAPKTQKSRQIAEIPAMISNQPNSVILDTVWGAYPDSNRRKQLHKLLCYRYTIGTITGTKYHKSRIFPSFLKEGFSV